MKRREALYLKPLPDAGTAPNGSYEGSLSPAVRQTIFCREERRGKGKKSPIVSQPDQVAPIMEARAALALPWPTPKSDRVIKLNYCSKTSVAGRPQNTSITWRESVSAAPAHRGFFQSGWLLTMPACHPGEDDRRANITRRRSRRRGMIQTQ